MTDEGVTKKPLIQYLSENQVEQIHAGSLDLLENTGIEVDHEAGLQALADAGADVDFPARRVKIPRDLVTRSLETVPDRFTLAARNPEKTVGLRR